MIALDVLRDDPSSIRGRHTGLVSNHTGLNATFQSTAEVLAALGARVDALFGPEHGFDGALQDALFVDHAVRRVPGAGDVPIYSLYRSDTDVGIPDGALDGLDLLVFDIQDVGARYYTYLSTLGIVLEAAADAGIPLLVLDRPNPLGGLVEGPGLDDDCRSFVGRYNMPIRHGLTMGEAARFINQNYLGGRGKVQVVWARDWRGRMLWPETGLQWVAPSPNMPTFTTALVYPGTCLFEGLNITEGRGTTQPFELIGAPWIEPREYADSLNHLDLPGVRFRPARFVPAFDRYADETCAGVQVHVTDMRAIRPVVLGLHMVVMAKKLYPKLMGWREPPPDGLYHFDRLIGSRKVRPAIDGGATVEDLTREWADNEREFAGRSEGCLLYS